MDTEQIYRLLYIVCEYVSSKDKINALQEILNHLYECDVDINELYNQAESDENDWLAKQIKIYIKENGLDDDYDEYDEE
jgi:hypothetical protein